MRQVEFVPFWLTDEVEIFTILIGGTDETEIKKFVNTYTCCPDPYLENDFFRIFQTLKTISENGAIEMMFRPEGKLGDRVCALPLLISPRNRNKHGTLRLYCIRLSDKLLIIGGGGEKLTRTYQESSQLLDKVRTLQQIDKELAKLEDKGVELQKEICNLVIYIQ